MTLRDYIILGVGRAGTTSIYNYSALHPDIYISPVKETGYFILCEGPSGLSGPDAEWTANPSSVTTLNEYESLFAEGSNHPVRGEASPKYMTHPEVPERIQP